MALVSVRQYARERGITEAAVRKRTILRGGPIATHGRAKQIEREEAARLWHTTMSPAGASTSRFHGPPETEAASGCLRGGRRRRLPWQHARPHAGAHRLAPDRGADPPPAPRGAPRR